MAADRSYIADNDRERRRLEALVGKLDDAALSRTMPDGWTVAGVLAHLAFWDQRIVTFIALLKGGVKVPGNTSASTTAGFQSRGPALRDCSRTSAPGTRRSHLSEARRRRW